MTDETRDNWHTQEAYSILLNVDEGIYRAAMECTSARELRQLYIEYRGVIRRLLGDNAELPNAHSVDWAVVYHDIKA